MKRARDGTQQPLQHVEPTYEAPVKRANLMNDNSVNCDMDMDVPVGACDAQIHMFVDSRHADLDASLHVRVVGDDTEVCWYLE